MSHNWTRQLWEKLLAMSFPMLEHAYTRNRSASSDLARQMCSTTMNFRCACIAQLLVSKKKMMVTFWVNVIIILLSSISAPFSLTPLLLCSYSVHGSMHQHNRQPSDHEWAAKCATLYSQNNCLFGNVTTHLLGTKPKLVPEKLL